MTELVEAGVNVHVVPTRHIPMPFAPASEEADQRLRGLAEDIQLYKGHGLILLFTGRGLWNQIKERSTHSVAQQALVQWARHLDAFMREQGVGDRDWALYLVDEPRNEDLEVLAQVIPVLRQEVPQLRFFANPIPSRGNHPMTRGTVAELGSLVEYWQPRAGVAYGLVRDVLPRHLPHGLWMYDNPCPPAKSASPNWYRGLARRAHDAGARGFGFWSFSATNKSSAWNDLDGDRPDWAVVYEAESGFVSSRRWEAFKLGIQEYAALRYCARQSNPDPTLAKQCRDLVNSTAVGVTECLK
jgi:hypothetical protein